MFYVSLMGATKQKSTIDMPKKTENNQSIPLRKIINLKRKKSHGTAKQLENNKMALISPYQ